VIVVPQPPPGATKAIIGSSPTAEIIGGIFAIILGIVILAASASFSSPAFPGAPAPPPFGLIGIIPILIGIVMLALGAMGISIPQTQVTYQTSSTPSYMRAGDSAYDYTPKSFLKPCPRCGQEIPIAALACYHCGAVF
jgi:hypothetical protein